MGDLGLDDAEYQTGLSILFVAYILMQVPSNLLLNYMGKPSVYLGFFTTAWGLVSTLTSQVTGYGGIVACRFVLGLVEAPFFCGRAVLPLEVVYEEGAGVSDEYFLFGVVVVWYVLFLMELVELFWGEG